MSSGQNKRVKISERINLKEIKRQVYLFYSEDGLADQKQPNLNIELEIDRLVHEPVRLKILAYLSEVLLTRFSHTIPPIMMINATINVQ